MPSAPRMAAWNRQRLKQLDEQGNTQVHEADKEIRSLRKIDAAIKEILWIKLIGNPPAVRKSTKYLCPL